MEKHQRFTNAEPADESIKCPVCDKYPTPDIVVEFVYDKEEASINIYHTECFETINDAEDYPIKSL